MKKLMTILAFVLLAAATAPSCTPDEEFEEVVENSQLDHSYVTDDHVDDIAKP